MVLRLSCLATLFIVALGALLPSGFAEVSGALLSFVIAKFGWFFLLTVFGLVLFGLFLAFSDYGHIKLGQEDDEPEFSRSTWFSMLFSAGMGIGLVFWGVAEPVMHYASPPPGVTALTPDAANAAMRYTFFHWGIHPWAVYGVVALALAYFKFNRQRPGLISAVFEPLLGEARTRGPIGKIIDILAILATVFGVATSLGFGALQIGGGFKHVFGIDNTFALQVSIIAVATVLYLLSSMTGIERGIKWLSNFNVLLAGLLMLAVLLMGPTLFLVDTLTATLGGYLHNLVNMSLRLTPFREGTWVADWTLFYWAWWVTWAPFVGMFIARISRGRTIREFIIGVMLVPSLMSFAWFAVFGGTALHAEIFGQFPIVAAVQADVADALFKLLELLPGGALLAGLALLLIVSFFVTSADSATFVLGMMSSNGSLRPTIRVRLFWGVMQAAIAVVLLMSGGLKGLQSAAIVAALPFAVIMVLMSISLYRALAQELRSVHQREAARHRMLELMQQRR
ncbi:BCCT family transporter [Laribacter hongkongensis]|uniref:BCCT family transporter n=1 Tax=Laribacter hongkongensis TaxID=168471 RepID=A0ABD4SPP2_9NEIS|nr:BCCT family transporter [Laribacter hongkongensis]MCG9025253.1 BCCT family transporter [Laribacter hongkongensis]MCG9099880.1 BCCT family transporter [Laribacter hongkongensis]MCG9103318.1 BCCT family transporter [Laribacter hongkongensis]MCG9111358.1 BCCT family transporter [Laribacter hongkongensis]MCG9119135.1 BCCT family transporter [Laribacter hongkongensis]